MGKRNTNIFIVFIFIIFLTIPASAIECEASGLMGRINPNENITLREACPTCTYLNITVTDPNSNILFQNQPMTLSNGIFTYSVLSGNHTKAGTYFVDGTSNLDNPFKACYIVSNADIEISTSESLLYMILTILSILIFLFCLWGAIVIPFSNSKNAFERVIDITWAKYWKLLFIALTYGLFIWMNNLALTITQNSIAFTQFNGFFEMIFNTTMLLAWPFFISLFLFANVCLIKDLKLVQLLQRRITPR